MNPFQKIKALIHEIEETALRIQELQKAVGRVELRQLQFNSDRLQDYEFKAFSQWGEDGVIQFLIRRVKIDRKIFVEFGVENYLESNTRFLLQNDRWSGLVIDGSPDNIRYIKQDPIYWGYNLKADCAFVNRDNINELLISNGISGDIGLLSIDIDGVDYWVWEVINCITPRIVICEYNSFFGCDRKVTIPYDKEFSRRTAHFSNTYWGASIAALAHLASLKGYALVGSNSAGNNVFFVRNDVVGDLRVYSPVEAYVRAQFRDSRDQHGNLTFLDFDHYLDPVGDMPLYDLHVQRVIKVRDLMSRP